MSLGAAAAGARPAHRDAEREWQAAGAEPAANDGRVVSESSERPLSLSGSGEWI